MLPLADSRWSNLQGGYRTNVNIPKLIEALDDGKDDTTAWEQLWNELHHQGDVDLGSYAAIPHLIRIHRRRGLTTWNTYGLVATILLASREDQNPDIPDWLQDDLQEALTALAAVAHLELPTSSSPLHKRLMLAVIAISSELPEYAKVMVDFSPEEISSLEERLWDR